MFGRRQGQRWCAGSWLLIAVLAPVVTEAPLLAQVLATGGVGGRVRDVTGAPLRGATVTAQSAALIGGSQVAVTDPRGIYRFPSLPVGSYVLEVALRGFHPLRQEALAVQANKVLAVDFDLRSSSVREEVTVSAPAPLVSVVDNRTGTTFDARFVRNQPLLRSYYLLFRSAPGVNVDYRAAPGAGLVQAYGGTTQSQNGYNLDGFDISDAASGGQWVQSSFEWMEEIQIGGLGANAEYGGYTGGLVNGVTKSGGNEVHGSVLAQHQPSDWVSETRGVGAGGQFEYSGLAGSLGGRIVRDRLWYFASSEYVTRVATPFEALDSTDRKVMRSLGKLTLRLDPANRLALLLERDSIDSERILINRLTLPEATWRQDWAISFLGLTWESQLDAANFVSVRVGGHDGREKLLPYNGFDLPGRVDVASGLAWVNRDVRRINHRRRRLADGAWSLFARQLLDDDDSHSFKFGGSYEQGESSDVWRRNGGFTYFDNSALCASFEAYLADPSCGRFLVERGWGEFDSHPKHHGFALYAQDSMRFERVTVNLGLRYGNYRGGWQTGHGSPEVFRSSFLDPRIGLAWDVRGDARTAVKVHWGRYHDKVYSYLFDRESSGRAALPDVDCFWNEGTGAYDRCSVPSVQRAKMSDARLARVDEFLLSVEQQFGGDLVLALGLTDRRFRDILAMVNANEDYELLTASNPLTGGALPIWNLLSPSDWVLTAENAGYRDFRSATLRFDKTHDRGWSGRASVVYADFEGNLFENNGYSRELLDRNGSHDSDGRMAYCFNEWEVKLSGDAELPLGFQISAQFTYLSGWYWTAYGRIAGLDFNALSGRDINLLPRGSEQLPDRQLLDLHLAWSPRLGRGIDLTVSVDVFNVLNADTVLDVQNRWGLYQLADQSWQPRSDFGAPTRTEEPREFRAGLRLDF